MGWGKMCVGTAAAVLAVGCSMSEADVMAGGGGAPASEVGRTNTAGSGVLTAGTWDDNSNFDFYQTYIQNRGTAIEGALAIPRHDRAVVTVVDPQGVPVAGAVVVLRCGGQEVFHTITGADGRVIILPSHYAAGRQGACEVETRQGNNSKALPLPEGTTQLTVVQASPAAATGLDVAFVVDTTGSMGDEIEFLNAEFQAISAELANRFPNVSQRFALVLYRDQGDQYVVRTHDFDDDASRFQQKLGGMAAGGGGDYPEAPDQALQATAALSWRDGATSRVAFLVADAPQHTNRGTQMVEAIMAVHQRGIHVYPVAASGTDPLAEFSMRTAAQVTGGRYVFLTDDSGVGGGHQEPTLPCYQVTLLKTALVRMLSIEVSGQYMENNPDDVMRVGGDPQDGRCALPDGSQVHIY